MKLTVLPAAMMMECMLYLIEAYGCQNRQLARRESRLC